MCNYSYFGINQTTQESGLTGGKVHGIKDRKVCADKNILWSGKEWTPQTQYSVGGRSFVAVGQ